MLNGAGCSAPTAIRPDLTALTSGAFIDKNPRERGRAEGIAMQIKGYFPLDCQASRPWVPHGGRCASWAILRFPLPSAPSRVESEEASSLVQAIDIPRNHQLSNAIREFCDVCPGALARRQARPLLAKASPDLRNGVLSHCTSWTDSTSSHTGNAAIIRLIQGEMEAQCPTSPWCVASPLF